MKTLAETTQEDIAKVDSLISRLRDILEEVDNLPNAYSRQPGYDRLVEGRHWLINCRSTYSKEISKTTVM